MANAVYSIYLIILVDGILGFSEATPFSVSLSEKFVMNVAFQSSNNCCMPQRAGSHFDISISINMCIRKICVNRGYTCISIRMATAQVQFTSQESKMAYNEVYAYAYACVLNT